MDVNETLKVILYVPLILPQFNNYQSAANVFRLLNASNHEVYLWTDIYNATEITSYLPQSDAIVIPYLYNDTLVPSVLNLLQTFAYGGGRVVTIGEYAANNLEKLFFSPEYIVSYNSAKSFSYGLSEFNTKFGYNLNRFVNVSENSIFHPHELPGFELPIFTFPKNKGF